MRTRGGIFSLHRMCRFTSSSRVLKPRLFSNAAIDDGCYDSKQIELMMNDECILVDTDDVLIGHASKKECHLTANALLHRAFSVLLFDSENRLLLQERAR